MKVPKEHKTYLAKYDYPLKCSLKLFKPEEIKFLRRYGHWIEALANGKIAPITDQEQRLVEVHKGSIEPKNKNEKLWRRLIERRLWEVEAKKLLHYKLVDKSEEFFSRSDWKKMRNWGNL
jgi:uncharacterized protein YifE (UPF0438 family)